MIWHKTNSPEMEAQYYKIFNGLLFQLLSAHFQKNQHLNEILCANILSMMTPHKKKFLFAPQFQFLNGNFIVTVNRRHNGNNSTGSLKEKSHGRATAASSSPWELMSGHVISCVHLIIPVASDGLLSVYALCWHVKKALKVINSSLLFLFAFAFRQKICEICCCCCLVFWYLHVNLYFFLHTFWLSQVIFL